MIIHQFINVWQGARTGYRPTRWLPKKEKNTKYNKNKISTSEQFHKVMLITTTTMQQ